MKINSYKKKNIYITHVGRDINNFRFVKKKNLTQIDIRRQRVRTFQSI